MDHKMFSSKKSQNLLQAIRISRNAIDDHGNNIPHDGTYRKHARKTATISWTLSHPPTHSHLSFILNSKRENIRNNGQH